jgi:hypothetical protein
MTTLSLRAGIALIVTAAAGGACRDSASTPSSPSAVAAPPVQAISVSAPVMGVSGPQAVVFPPRNEPALFRRDLEAKYRDGLGAPITSSYVDQEGGGVWIQEYLRYRVNRCTHPDATAKVFRQIDGLGIEPICGEPPPGVVEFPPRNEPNDFRNLLEVKYRDGLRASLQSTYVNNEGDVTWMQEYIRYRLNGCGHADATTRVFAQIDGRGVQPVCTVPLPQNVEIRAVIFGPTAPFNSNTDQTFFGTDSTSNQGRIVSYQWGCGQPANTTCSSSSATPTFRYAKTAILNTIVNYTVSLEVRDSQGNSARTTFPIRVIQRY